MYLIGLALAFAERVNGPILVDEALLDKTGVRLAQMYVNCSENSLGKQDFLSDNNASATTTGRKGLDIL